MIHKKRRSGHGSEDAHTWLLQIIFFLCFLSSLVFAAAAAVVFDNHRAGGQRPQSVTEGGAGPQVVAGGGASGKLKKTHTRARTSTHTISKRSSALARPAFFICFFCTCGSAAATLTTQKSQQSA